MINKSAMAIGLVCVALGAFDIKLLGDLNALRAANEPRAPAGSVPATVEVEAIDEPPSAPGLSVVLGDRAMVAEANAARAAASRPDDADFRRMYDDPRLRLQLIAEGALSQRNRFRGAERTLGIEPDRWIMLSDRLAESEIEARARRLRCAPDLACPPGGMDSQWFSEDERTIREVLGEVKAEEFKKYRDTLQERRAVEGLQSRLRTAQLPPERADALILALADERARVGQDWAHVGPSVTRGFGTPELGTVFYPASAATPEQRLAAATDYSRRMRERAARLLTPEQRTIFDAMQDELLDRFQRIELRRQRGG